MVHTVRERAAGAAPPLPTASEVLGRAGGENFTVASRILGRRRREALLAIYGWARLVDEVGDSYRGDRLAALDRLDQQLGAALAGETAGVHPLVAAAAAQVARWGTGERELRGLLEANRQDQRVGTYSTFDELLGYCRLSANPVGRLVLLGFGVSTPERVAWSDAVCTALQLAEHWQDLAEDSRAGRCYLPEEDLRRFGLEVADVHRAAADRRAPWPLRGLVSWEVWRARQLLDQGAPLVGSLRGGDRVAVAGFVAGGRAALDAVAAVGYDPFPGAPAPARARLARHFAGLVANGGAPA